MKSRLIVAAILIPAVFVLTFSSWQHHLLFALLVAAAMSLAMLEFYELVREYRPYVPAGLAAVALTPVLAWRANEPGIFAAMLAAVPLIMIFALFSVERRNPAASLVATLAGVAYIAPAAGLAMVLRSSPHGLALVVLLLLAIWANDTGAYFTGKLVGRHKLAPRISPGKTIEGFVGGVLVGTFVMWYGHFLTGEIPGEGAHWLSGTEALGVGVAVALATPLGDLFESMVKRSVGVKDSGRLLGDHGGMLDRVDSLLVAIPVMYVGAFLVGAL